MVRIMPCSVEGCSKPKFCRGWCSMHYARWRRHGDPITALVVRDGTHEEVYLSHIEIDDDGCEVWTGAVSHDGYAKSRVGGTDHYVARTRWEAINGPVPDGMVLDHLCHTNSDCAGGIECKHRRCVRVDHLEPVTPAENLRRSRRHSETHCKHGNLRTAENTYVRPDGRKECMCRVRRIKP